MEREAKAKVVASVSGGKICSISCRASCFAFVYLDETFEFNGFLQIKIEKILPTQTYATTFALASLSIVLLWKIPRFVPSEGIVLLLLKSMARGNNCMAG